MARLNNDVIIAQQFLRKAGVLDSNFKIRTAMEIYTGELLKYYTIEEAYYFVHDVFFEMDLYQEYRSFDEEGDPTQNITTCLMDYHYLIINPSHNKIGGNTKSKAKTWVLLNNNSFDIWDILRRHFDISDIRKIQNHKYKLEEII
jgi:hypothetical protein